MEDKTSEVLGLTREDEFYVWVMLWRAAKAMMKVRQRELRKSDLSPAQTSVLHVVHAWDNQITPAGISRELLRDPNTITELLISMEKDGLVKRVKDLPKKNMIRVELTEKGNESYKKATREQAIFQVLAVLSKEEQHRLLSYLNRITAKSLECLK